MFRQRAATRIGVGAGILGLILIVFGSVWITVVFPGFEKIPSDWEQIDELQGTFTFVDEPFLTQLQKNPTISQLLSAPGALDLLADPAVQSIVGNPAVGQLVSSPDLLGLLQNPSALQVLTDPALAGLLSNPDVLALLQDPAFLAALGDPAALPQLAEHPVAGPLLADPAVLSLLQDPAFLGFLQSGVLATLATQPQLLELLRDPALGAVLANPVVQQLMADPAAMPLLLDARTQQLLANPADLPTITVPVVLHRERRATSAEGDKIVINEQVTTLDPTTRQEVQGFDKTDIDLIIRQKTREYLPGTEGGRTGLWGLPFNVEKDRSYSSWVTAAERPLEAEYRGTEKIQGLETFIHVVEVTNLPLGVNDPATGLPLVVDALITTWSEPRTGSTVRIEDSDAVSAWDELSGNKYPRFVADVNHTEETITTLVNDAKNNRNKLVWFGSYMPWISMGVGIFLTVAAATVIGAGMRGSRQDTAS